MLRNGRYFLLIFGLWACSTPTPKTGCRDDAECGGGQECRQGACVPKGSVACTVDSDCNASDPALNLKQPGPCEELKCVEGLCAYPAKADGPCDDKNSCTTGDLCVSGVCQAGVQKDCQDSNPCTDDACDATSGSCTHTANTATCDDGVACTHNDACENKACVGTPNDATCTDGNGCTDDSCDATKGCKHVANTAGCDDGDACTTGDVCAGGKCASGTPKDCSDGNACTADTCAAGTCGHATLPDQATCTDDGLACTIDACASGVCAHVVQSGSCLIDGGCFGNGATSADGCLVCDATTAPLVWSAQAVGTACQKGAICQVGVCTAQHVCNVTGTAPGYCFIDQVCVPDGQLNPANSCALCLAGNQSSWSLADDLTPCDTDNVACTDDVCASGVCQHVPNAASCTDKTSACTVGVCDGKNGCVAMPSDVTTACNSDKNACTLEHCGNKTGLCQTTSAVLDCDDGVACTLDACDPIGGCTHTVPSNACDDGNSCTTDSCNPTADCQHSDASGPCSLQGDLACSADVCSGGMCKAGAIADTCIIDGACVAAGTQSDGGCKTCAPGQNTFAWTLASVGSSCAGDGIGCTSDACDAGGACLHTASDSLCAATPDTCTMPLCKPGDPGADATTGCVAVDDCPVGHHCDATAKACLTEAPIAIVTAGGDHPNPTNPAILRHMLDAKTGTTRTWIVFQTETCASASNGQWSITKPAGLRAAVVDSVVGTPASKATTALAPVPIVALPTATGWADSAAVCQGFPEVAHDPLAANLGWLSWLEAAPGQTPACLTANGQGGLVRLARLDAAAAVNGGIWDAVAGDAADLASSVLCTAKDAFLPSFLTAGFGILPVAGTDVTAKGFLSVRPNAGTLNSLGGTQLLRVGTAGENTSTTTNPITGSFSQIHPVVLDIGTLEAARFLAVGMTQKLAAGTTTHALWAVPISELGVDDSPVEWSKGTTPATGSGTGDLKDITAVCAMDASVDAAGTVGVAIVVRRGGKDAVLLVTRAAGSATGVVTTVREQASSDPGCAVGLSSVRVVGRTAGDFVVQWLDSTGPVDATKGGIWLTSTANNLPTQLATLTAWDTDGSAAPLAWRGLGGLVAGANGVVTTVVEGRSGTARTLFLHSLKL